MIFLDFLTSLHLDPVIFNPFITTDQYCVPLFEYDGPEGDDYELEESVPMPTSVKLTQTPTRDDVTRPHVIVSNETEEPISDVFLNNNSCCSCLNCKLSDDISDGSSCKICSVTGEYISDPDLTAESCEYYSVKSSDYAEEIENEV
jgi:hypothetical protein